MEAKNVKWSFHQMKLTGSDKVSRSAVTKLVKDTISVCLLHLCMDVVARIPKFGNFFCKQFNAIDGIAKDDALVDFELGKECVEAVDLLSLFDIGVELCDTTKREFVH